MLEQRFQAPEGWQWRDNLETRSGQFIRIGWTIPKNARALVTIFPGLSEYSEKYFETARDLIKRGFAVACVDWRGQGMSWRYGSRDKRYHDDFENDVVDAKAYLANIPASDKLPRIMLAHSMGGHIGMRVLHDKPSAFKCAVMSAPLFGLNVPETMAMGIARTMHMMGMGESYIPAHGPWTRERFDSNLSILTSDDARKNMQVYWMDTVPELRMGGLTVAWIMAALASIRLVRDPRYLKTVTTPVLLVRGDHDMVVSNPAIGNVEKLLPEAQLLTVNGALHEILMERDVYRDQFWTAFDAFVENHL